MPTDHRRNPAGNQHYDIKQMWERHHQIARLLVLGWSNKQVASHLSITPQTVSNARNNPEVKRQIDLLSARADNSVVDVSKRIQDLAPRALGVMEEVMDDAEFSTKRLAAKDILEMAGYKAVSRLTIATARLSAEDIEDIKARAAAMGYLRREDAEDAEDAVIVEEGDANHES